MLNFGKRRNYSNLDDGGPERSTLPTTSTRLRKLVPVILIFGIAGITCVFLFVSSNKGGGVGSSAEPLLEKGKYGSKESKGLNSNITQVRISNGILEGIVLKSRRGRDFSAFYNIPYAKPAIGELRFEPPQEFTERWAGIRNASQPGTSCIQTSSSNSETGVKGEENCHHLSVYVPNVLGKLPRRSPKKLLPVMVYFLGGAFTHGHASIYGGEYMMDKDVIIVLPETRFGVLGFFSTGDSIVPGNMGFKDQTMVLKWVQAQIAKFGGNPKKVTIFGNSSGASSVHLHMMSDMSAGLFHRAISQSGVGITSPNSSIDVNPIANAVELGKKCGCPLLNDTRQLVSCLKGVNVSALVQAAADNELRPVVLEDVNSKLPFLTQTPLSMMEARSHHSQNIPWILGVNSDEMNIASTALALLPPPMLENLNENWDLFAPTLLNLGSDPGGNNSRQIKEFYFGDKPISNDTRLNFTALLDDRNFVHPTYLTATLQANFTTGNNNVYLYVLNKKPIKSLGSMLEDIYDPPYGVTHADEVQYFFPYPKFPYIGLDSPDLKMSEELVDIWTTFADTGEPYHGQWEPLKAGEKATQVNWFQLDDEAQSVHFAGDRMEFWDSLPMRDLYA